MGDAVIVVRRDRGISVYILQPMGHVAEKIVDGMSKRGVLGKVEPLYCG